MSETKAAIGEKTKPLVEALRAAREALSEYAQGLPPDVSLSLAMQIDRALASFTGPGEPKGGER